MKKRYTLLSLALLVLGTGLVWVWQYGQYRRFRQAELDAAARYEQVVFAALTVSLHRQCRRVGADLENLAATFADMRRRLDASYLGVLRADGRPFLECGTLASGEGCAVIDRSCPIELPAHLVGPVVEEGGSQEACLRPAQRCGGCGLPPDLARLRLQYPARRLQEKVDRERRRFVLVSGAATLAFLFIFLFTLSRRRALGLREELAAAAERVRSLEFLSRLGAGLAHETKNPLGSIRGFGEMLRRRDLPVEEVRQAAKRIVDETDRIVSRLDEFLLLSRPARPRRERVDLVELLADLGQMIRPELEARGGRLDLEGSALVVSADREQVRRLFLNLLVNALEFIEREGSITVRVEGGESARVVVADDGPGVEASIRETLFEPYVSGRPGGTGLGLAIARRIAREHGWRIRYEPGAEKGTRMIVEMGDR